MRLPLGESKTRVDKGSLADNANTLPVSLSCEDATGPACRPADRKSPVVYDEGIVGGRHETANGQSVGKIIQDHEVPTM